MRNRKREGNDVKKRKTESPQWRRVPMSRSKFNCLDITLVAREKKSKCI